MILEGIVTTLSPAGAVNVAPMGPQIGAAMDRFTLRPFRTADTLRNLKTHGEGVLHVTDDVLLLAAAAIGKADPALVPARHVRGYVLKDCCRYYEFRVSSLDDSAERARVEVEVVHSGRLRDFFGFNRAKHAVVEAAILATRTEFIPFEEIDAEYRKLGVIIHKTGGEQEERAFALLSEHVARQRDRRRDRATQPADLGK